MGKVLEKVLGKGREGVSDAADESVDLRRWEKVGEKARERT